jgi:O-antigen/teichoic acid export membrane protein
MHAVTCGAPESLEKQAKIANFSGLRIFGLRIGGLRHALGKFNLKPILIVAAGNGGSAAMSIAATWMMATKLTPAQFGAFSLALAIMTVLQEIGGPSLDIAIVRFASSHSRSDPLRAEAYFRAGYRLKLLISGLLAAGLALLAGFLADNVYHEQLLRPLFYWMAAGLVVANLSTFILARLQAAERFLAYSVQRILVNFLKVLLLALAWAIDSLDLHTVPAAWTLSFVLSYLIGVRACPAPRGHPRNMPGDRPYGEIAGFAKWVMLSGLFFALHMRADILLLGSFRTAAEVGYYSIAWNLMLLLDLITSSIISALLPKASKITPGDSAGFGWTILAASAVIAAALSPLYFFSDTLITAFFPKYLPAIGTFHILFWSSIVVLLIYPLYLGFYSQNKPARVSVTYGILVVASVTVGFTIIPQYGLPGAAYTTFIARAIGGAVILMFLFTDWHRSKGVAANNV